MTNTTNLQNVIAGRVFLRHYSYQDITNLHHNVFFENDCLAVLKYDDNKVSERDCLKGEAIKPALNSLLMTNSPRLIISIYR